jgi:hypothetical protein
MQIGEGEDTVRWSGGIGSVGLDDPTGELEILLDEVAGGVGKELFLMDENISESSSRTLSSRRYLIFG